MKQVNIIIGRFQPITNGHMACIREAWNEKHIPTIICMINTKEEKVDPKHPFPSQMLLALYNKLFEHDKMVEDIILVPNADIVKIGEELYSKQYEVASWTCGTDRYNDYKRMSDKYKEQAHLADNFELIEIKRGDEDISATKVRKALMDDDIKTFNMMTPFGSLKNHISNNTEAYDILRDQILKVNKK